MQFSSKAKGGLAVLAFLTAIGVCAWVYQLINGLGVTGMSNVNSWGLYIASFMLFVGLSAGGLIVASSASVFHIKQYKQVAVPAVITSTVCIMIAALFILIDLGGVQRIWRLFAGPNFTSPLLWDVCVVTTYLVINILDLLWMCGKNADDRKVEALSRVALPVAILVHSVTAWIFGLQIARAWYTAIMAPIFVASALDSGLAILLIALVCLDKVGLFALSKDVFKSLAGLLVTCIAVDAFFIGCEVLTMAYPGAGESVALSHMLTGATAPFFWAEIIGGLLVPFLILVFAKNRENTALVIVASTLVVCGVFCKRIWLLLTSFITPNVYGGPGISLGTSDAIATHSPASVWATVGTYAPTAFEIAIWVGVISLGVIMFTMLSKKLLSSRAA